MLGRLIETLKEQLDDARCQASNFETKLATTEGQFEVCKIKFECYYAKCSLERILTPIFTLLIYRHIKKNENGI